VGNPSGPRDAGGALAGRRPLRSLSRGGLAFRDQRIRRPRPSLDSERRRRHPRAARRAGPAAADVRPKRRVSNARYRRPNGISESVRSSGARARARRARATRAPTRAALDRDVLAGGGSEARDRGARFPPARWRSGKRSGLARGAARRARGARAASDEDRRRMEESASADRTPSAARAVAAHSLGPSLVREAVGVPLRVAGERG